MAWQAFNTYSNSTNLNLNPFLCFAVKKKYFNLNFNTGICKLKYVLIILEP